MMQPTFRRFHRLPDVVSGAPLSHFIGVIIPLDRTNMVTNPSIELATTNYTAVGGSIARSSTKQYHGTYSLAITPSAATTDGAYYGTIALTSGTSYVLSCKFWGLPGVKYKISFATTGGVDLAVKAFIGTGRWQWVWTPIYNETSTTTRRLYFTKNTHTSTGVFYVDGVQVESVADGILKPTTYIDGDQPSLLVGQSPPGYGWNGTPHASTSYRTSLTRAGGYVMDIKTAYGFLLTGLIGLGMAVPNNVSIPYTVLDGARYQRTTKPPRTLALAGRFQASTRTQLDRLRSDMRAALDRDLVPLQQPLILQVEPHDDCGEVSGDFAQIQCLYAGGLEGNDSSALAEDAAPAFTMYLPFLLGGDGGASLSVQQTVTNANAVLRRSATGVWSALTTGVTGGIVYTVARGLNGLYYVGGSFTAAGGVANTKFIASFDPGAGTWAALGTGAGGVGTTVNILTVAPNGDIWAVGNFTAMGGVAGADSVARWDGSAWNAVGVPSAFPIAGTSTSATFDAAGNFYYPTVTNSTVKKWNGAAWSTLGTVAGSGAFVRHVIRAPNGTALAIGGDFTSVNGVAAIDAAYWNGSAWSALGTPPGNIVAMAYGPDNVLYAGGDAATSNLWKWTGATWTQIGAVGGTGTAVSKIAPALPFAGLNPSNLLYVSGNFTTANGVTIPDSFGVWNGTALMPTDANLPGTATVYAIASFTDGTMLVGYDQTGSAVTAATTTVTNTAAAYVWLKLVIKGPSSGTSRIFQLVNYTTGFGVWLNYTINAGETATFIFDPQNPSFTSDFQGDLTGKILPGSQPSLMYLVPGANSLSFYADSSTVTAVVNWRNRYNGVADLVN